jgi:hypothetical protein
MAEAPSAVSKWRRLVENSILTAYYRILSFVSVHCPITEAYETCVWLSENTPYGGNVYYLIEPRIFVWENVIVNQNPENPITMTLRVFGSPLRGVNTVFARAGWMFMYTTGPVVDKLLLWVGDAWKKWTGWR